MIDTGYREIRVIRPHTENAISIEVRTKCDSMSDVVAYAKTLQKLKTCENVVCDNILYLIDGMHYPKYLITRIVNM